MSMHLKNIQLKSNNRNHIFRIVGGGVTITRQKGISIDYNMLIRKVRNHSILWQLENEHYKDKILKNSVWLQIQEEMKIPGVVVIF